MEKRIKATASFFYVFNCRFFATATIDFPPKYVHIGNSRQICMHEGRHCHSTLLERRSFEGSSAALAASKMFDELVSNRVLVVTDHFPNKNNKRLKWNILYLNCFSVKNIKNKLISFLQLYNCIHIHDGTISKMSKKKVVLLSIINFQFVERNSQTGEKY